MGELVQGSEQTCRMCGVTELGKARQKLRVLLLAWLLIGFEIQGTWACPELCECDGLTVTCSDATEIPVDIPPETTVLMFPRHRFTNLPGYTFVPHNLRNLRELHLRRGNLEVINENAFHGLPELTKLHLDYNNLQNIDANAFDSLGKVDHLYLYYNKLQRIRARQFVGLPALRWMSLSFNALTDIPANAFQGLEHLTTLYIRYNHLSELGDYQSFSGLHKLQMLSLENNHALRTVGDETFSQLYSLTDLELGGNQLTSDSFTEATFSGLHKLHTLNFHNNPLGLVPSLALKAIPQLDTLRLTSCQLRSVRQNDFEYAPDLKQLFLDDNVALKQIPAHTLSELEQLEILDFSRNSVTDILAFSFQNATSLKKLFITDSKLSGIEEDGLDGLVNLDELNLSNNELTTLPKTALDSIPYSDSLKIDLGDNPWACDCHLRDFLQWVDKHYDAPQIQQIFNITEHQPKCLSPPQNAGRSIFDIPTHDLSCEAPPPKDIGHEENQRRVTIGSCVGLAIVVILCTVLSILFYRRRQRKLRDMLRRYGSRDNVSSFPLDDNVSI
ncbi:carboxypeptidase N subunit 2-like [Acanthaster planci]|uniref:Carboxypeptidase N subunit 2-like n=1 Tax=Acanthaster planci TaxID=133434 RepID=A0A8B7ZD44_ACAPL|nr:carboxypeptidase N subunit 2-like [Acanthaster planci]XP_022101120.1 carboxypeptidase N subunit 2-like [Acanthaster planci]XP_022101129.1 carboxypeptidase N subunit 2-like [Acanthaster planci]